MHKSFFYITLFICSFYFSACASPQQNKQQKPSTAEAANTNSLPAPYATKSNKNFSKVVGWQEGQTPVAPAGFTVSKFAEGLENPRWIYAATNGDIFIAESNTVLTGIKKFGASVSRKIKTQNLGRSANRIRLFRDADKNGSYEKSFVFAEDLNQPFGMLILDNHFYVANTDGLEMYDYANGDTTLSLEGKRIVELPAGGYNNHWTRNIVANEDGTKIYISVGSGSNNGENGMENEVRRANILEINPDGSGEIIYAAGLRNPVGLGFEPSKKMLWTAVNERDGLGDDLVPDYATSVKQGGFYGWPYAYFGANADPRMKDDPYTELVNKTLVPDVALGAHTASLGLAFYTKNNFPQKYKGGMFIGQHGSWNRAQFSGYKVVFIPFANGTPSGKPEDFLTGFIADQSKDEVYGRPVGVTVINDGSLLVADDASKIVWRVRAK